MTSIIGFLGHFFIAIGIFKIIISLVQLHCNGGK